MHGSAMEAMGFSDRPYAYEDRSMRPSLPTVTKTLLIANIVVLLLGLSKSAGLMLSDLGAFTIREAIFQGHVWQFLTFQFLHAGLGHILGNMIALYFFGSMLERLWGGKRFLVFYLLCGAAGAAFYTLLFFLRIIPGTIDTPLVGASAGIYGILTAIAIIAPATRVQFFLLPINISIRTLALVFLGIAFASAFLGIGPNRGGEAGHLGGAILGFLLTKFTYGLALLDRDRERKIIRPKAFQRRTEAKLRPRSHSSVDNPSEVDRILEKVHNHGMHSLTDAERATLSKAAESSRKRKP